VTGPSGDIASRSSVKCRRDRAVADLERAIVDALSPVI
jgi:hypothetical protein